MKFKKIVCGALSLAMALSLAACGGGRSTSTPAPSAPATVESAPAATPEAPALPDGYPSKNIDWLVPVAAGASLDLHIRALDQIVDFGSTTSVTNMVGASQVLGLTELLSREADGYTIGCSAFAGSIIQPAMGNTDYTVDDFRPIAALNEPTCNIILAKPGSDVDTWEGLKDRLLNGDTVYYTTNNVGAVPHIAFLSMLDQLGTTNAELVSFDGAAACATAVMGGHVDIAILDIGPSANYVKEGTLVNVLTVAEERSPILPDSPSAGEVGFEGMDAFAGFIWVTVSKDMPEPIVEFLREKITAALESDEYKEFLATQNETVEQFMGEEEINARLAEAAAMYNDIFTRVDM